MAFYSLFLCFLYLSLSFLLFAAYYSSDTIRMRNESKLNPPSRGRTGIRVLILALSFPSLPLLGLTLPEGSQQVHLLPRPLATLCLPFSSLLLQGFPEALLQCQVDAELQIHPVHQIQCECVIINSRVNAS